MSWGGPVHLQQYCRLRQTATGGGDHDLIFWLTGAFWVASPGPANDDSRQVSDPEVASSGQGLQSSVGGFLFKPLGFCNLPELKFLFLSSVGAEI